MGHGGVGAAGPGGGDRGCGKGRPPEVPAAPGLGDPFPSQRLSAQRSEPSLPGAGLCRDLEGVGPVPGTPLLLWGRAAAPSHRWGGPASEMESEGPRHPARRPQGDPPPLCGRCLSLSVLGPLAGPHGMGGPTAQLLARSTPQREWLPSPLRDRLCLPLEKLHSHPSPQPSKQPNSTSPFWWMAAPKLQAFLTPLFFSHPLQSLSKLCGLHLPPWPSLHPLPLGGCSLLLLFPPPQAA